MKGKIKILSLLLAVAMTASMFVACTEKEPGTTSGTDSKPGTESKDTPDAPPEKKDPVKLKWYTWGPPPAKGEAVFKALNEKSMADIQTEIDFIYANDEEAVKMLCSTGGEYDIVFSCNWYNNFVTAAAGGQFADITDIVETASPDLYSFIPEAVWSCVKIGGKIYGVPTYKDTAPEQFWQASKEYVIDGAKAEAEFKATGEKLATVTPLLEKVKAYADAGNPYPNDLTAPFNFNVAGLNGHDTGWDVIDAASFSGVKISDASAKVMNHLEDADYVEQLKVLKDWNTRGLVNRNALQTEAEPTFMVVGTVQGWQGCEGTLTNKFSTPIVTNHKYGPVYTTSGGQGSVNALSPNSQHKERALQYLQYANLDVTYRNMLAYGIEGANWKNEGGLAVKLNDDYRPGAFSQATFFGMIPEAPAKPDMYTNLKSVMDNAESSPIVGFVPNVEAVKTEAAACAAIIEPVKKELLTGSAKDVDAKVKETLEALKSNGYEKLRTELQKQVDAFIAAK